MSSSSEVKQEQWVEIFLNLRISRNDSMVALVTCVPYATQIGAFVRDILPAWFAKKVVNFQRRIIEEYKEKLAELKAECDEKSINVEETEDFERISAVANFKQVKDTDLSIESFLIEKDGYKILAPGFRFLRDTTISILLLCE